MKHILYIFLIPLLLIPELTAQCGEVDAKIWKDTWRSCTPTKNPISKYGKSHWIQYNLGSVRNLSKSWVWNTNDPDRLDQGLQDVMIDYSIDGVEWTTWGKMTFPKANGDAVYGGFPGPDLSSISAQYVMITAKTNHGDKNCFGIAEIKFNLLPENIEPTENDNNDDGDEMECAGLEDIEIEEWVEIETEFTEAFVFVDNPGELEELYFIFEYREVGGEWQEIEFEEEIELNDLTMGTVYEYRLKIECEEELYTSPIGSFETQACQAVSDIVIEEVLETEAFLIWNEVEGIEFYIVEIGIVGEEKDDFEIEEAEVFLEDLEENTSYEVRIGIECGEAVMWSEAIVFTTQEEMPPTIAGVNDQLSVSQIRLFPNPTTGNITLRIKSPARDILNYSISTIDGRIASRNVVKISEGSTDLKLNVSNLPNGTYLLSGVGINSRATINGKIVKVSQ